MKQVSMLEMVVYLVTEEKIMKYVLNSVISFCLSMWILLTDIITANPDYINDAIKTLISLAISTLSTWLLWWLNKKLKLAKENKKLVDLEKEIKVYRDLIKFDKKYPTLDK